MPSRQASATDSYFFTASFCARMSSNCEMSAPEMNDLPPSPESTTQRMSSSRSARPRRTGTASHMSTESALCLAGLLKRMCRIGPSVQALTRSVGETYVVMSFISIHSFGFEAFERGRIEAGLRQDLFGVLAALRGRAGDLRWRARHDDGLPHQALLAEPGRDDLLDHAQVLHLLLLERLPDVVDGPAGNARLVERPDPVVAGLVREQLLDLDVQPLAVHVARGLARRALVPDPFGRADRLAEALPDLAAEDGEVDVAVLGPVDARRHAGRVEVAGLAGHLAVQRHARALEIHHVDHRLQERGLHPLALARGLALEESDGHAVRGEDAAAQVRDRDAHPQRAVPRQARHRHEAAHALRDLVEAGAGRVRAGLSEARDAGVYEARVHLRERRVIDAQAILHVGAEVLQQHVGALDQLLQHLDALRLLEVQGDRALVAVRVLVIRAVLPAEGVVPAHALGHLDLDHVGAPVGE